MYNHNSIYSSVLCIDGIIYKCAMYRWYNYIYVSLCTIGQPWINFCIYVLCIYYIYMQILAHYESMHVSMHKISLSLHTTLYTCRLPSWQGLKGYTHVTLLTDTLYTQMAYILSWVLPLKGVARALGLWQ